MTEDLNRNYNYLELLITRAPYHTEYCTNKDDLTSTFTVMKIIISFRITLIHALLPAHVIAIICELSDVNNTSFQTVSINYSEQRDHQRIGMGL